MTVVEFFDSDPIENVITCLASRPDRLILVGNRKQIERKIPALNRFLDLVGLPTEVVIMPVVETDLESIAAVLEDIVEQNEDCSFDLTGGNGLSLVAIGMVAERHRERGIQLHRYNIRTNTVYDCDLDGNVLESVEPTMSVEECICLHGGALVTREQRADGTAEWDFHPEFVDDIEIMWDICKANCTRWNLHTTALRKLMNYAQVSEDGLSWVVDSYYVDGLIEKGEFDYQGVCARLMAMGLLLDNSGDEGHFGIRYKNEQIKRCLDKAGTLLELVTYLRAAAATRPDGSYVYSDARTGVLIDWDGVIHEEDGEIIDVQNEIDVIVMKGMIPVFISCKNGEVEDEELYKLHTVATRFGGSYVKKVLITTNLGRKNPASRELFLQRAAGLQISVLEDVHLMSDDEFSKRLRLLAG